MSNGITSIPHWDIFIHNWDMGPNEKLKSGKQKVEITMKSKVGRTGKRWRAEVDKAGG
jgi:hypothetical protein